MHFQVVARCVLPTPPHSHRGGSEISTYLADHAAEEGVVGFRQYASCFAYAGRQNRSSDRDSTSKGFHDVLLAEGAVTIDVLRERVRRWIDASK